MFFEKCSGLPHVKYNSKTISQSSSDPDIVYIGLDIGNIVIIKYEGGKWRFVNTVKTRSGAIAGIVERSNKMLWALTEDPFGLYEISMTDRDTSVILYGAEKGIPDTRLSTIQKINNEYYVTTDSGIVKYDEQNDRFLKDNRLTGGFSEGKASRLIFVDEDGDIIFCGADTRNYEMLFRKGASRS